MSINGYLREECRFEGCKEPGGYISGYCKAHVNTAHPCMIGGCGNRVAAHSRSRCCKAHRREAVTMKRKGLKSW